MAHPGRRERVPEPLGTDLVLAAVTGAGSASVSYSVVSAGTTGCSFGSSGTAARTLSSTGAGTCTVKATAILAGYTTWNSANVDITFAAAEPEISGVNWDNLTTSRDFVAYMLLEVPNGSTADGLAVTYSVTSGGSICSLVSNTFTGMQIADNGECGVRATVTKEGHQTLLLDATITINSIQHATTLFWKIWPFGNSRNW